MCRWARTRRAAPPATSPATDRANVHTGVNAQNAFGTDDAAELLLPPLPFERNCYSRLNSLPPAGPGLAAHAQVDCYLARRPDSLACRP